MSLILCGLPGSGKSTLGKKLAKKLFCPFVDTDQLIEKTFPDPLSCREIYRKYGELYFRQIESETVLKLRVEPFSIIATGGGTFCIKKNEDHLKTLGKIVYLKADWEFLFSRAVENGYPAFLKTSNPKMAYKNLYEKRSKVFERIKDFSFDCQKHSLQEMLNFLTQLARGG